MANDWKEKRLVREVTISPTQNEEFNLCKRKWWFKRVRKLKEPSTTPQIFGTVVHSVCERFLLADDLGRDVDGKPVELYPPGWHIAENRYGGPPDGEVTPEEQDQIQRLITKAIEEGVLERLPGREIENQFFREVIELVCPECDGDGKEHNLDDDPCSTCDGDGKGTNFRITGLIDYQLSGEVQDHKTTKNMKYAKSVKKLAKAIPMLIYAKELLFELEEQGKPLPETITLRHNVFCKDPEKMVVRKTEAVVTVKEINEAWNQVIEDCVEMDRLRRTVDVWHEAPDPLSTAESCNAYGGCPFRPICSGRETEERYEIRLDPELSSKYNNNNQSKFSNIGLKKHNSQKGSEMTNLLAGKLAAKDAARTAVTDGAVNPPTPPQAQAPSPAPETPPPSPAQETAAPTLPPVQETVPTVVGDRPPWADPTCVACKDGINGFNSRGNACRICEMSAKRDGRPLPTDFVIMAAGDGTFVWEEKAGDLTGAAPTATGQQPIAAETRVKTPETPPVTTPSPSSAQESAPAEAPAKATTERKPGGGRKKKGFMLCINCSPVCGTERSGSGRGVVQLNKLLLEHGTKLAQLMGKNSYYDLDTWQRRDEMAKAAKNIADELGNDMLICSGIGTAQSDLRALVDALRPHAGMVMQAEQN